MGYGGKNDWFQKEEVMILEQAKALRDEADKELSAVFDQERRLQVLVDQLGQWIADNEPVSLDTPKAKAVRRPLPTFEDVYEVVKENKGKTPKQIEGLLKEKGFSVKRGAVTVLLNALKGKQLVRIRSGRWYPIR